MKDKEDLALEALFRSEPVRDAGFSRQVLKRVRRRIWLRRLALPIALAVGGAVAFQPAVHVLSALLGLVSDLSLSAPLVSAGSLAELAPAALLAAVTVAALIFAPLLED
ncbi:MAG: hypothetical protein AAF417_13235 [Pseudomonadota bacterium]